MGKQPITYQVHLNGPDAEHFAVINTNTLLRSHVDQQIDAVIIDDPVILQDQHWLVLDEGEHIRDKELCRCAVKASFLREVLDWDSITMDDDFVVVDDMEVSILFVKQQDVCLCGYTGVK